MAKVIHVHLGKKPAKDAGFTTYDPREVGRLKSEIKEIDAKIAATKGPISKRDLEQVKAKLVRELSKYHADDAQSLADLQRGYRAAERAGDRPAMKEFEAAIKEAEKGTKDEADPISKAAVEKARKDLAQAERMLGVMKNKMAGGTLVASAEHRVAFLKEELQKAEARPTTDAGEFITPAEFRKEVDKITKALSELSSQAGRLRGSVYNVPNLAKVAVSIEDKIDAALSFVRSKSL